MKLFVVQSTKMLIVGIETSCDDTCIAIINDRKILSNIVVSQDNIHNKFGGIEPEHAGRTHCDRIGYTYNKAFEEAGIEENDIDAIAVTIGPGLVGSLTVGFYFAKGLSIRLKKPLVPVDHLFSHIMVSRMLFDISFPFLGGIFSGGHSFLLLCESPTKFSIVGKTLDDAIGECFDKIGKAMGLPFPGGKFLSELAKSGEVIKNLLPIPLVNIVNCDFSLSGLKTNTILKIRSGLYSYADIAASFQYTIMCMIEQRLFYAIDKYPVKRIVLGGGVMANEYLRENINSFCKKHEISLFYPPQYLCTDNAVMTAWTAKEIFHENSGKNYLKSTMYANFQLCPL